MADVNGGHLVARTLREAGVRHVFTLCGGHILPIYDGCVTEDVRVVDMRHEQAAANAADAYARLTRSVGVAVVTAGPGVTDAVTGVANAHAARSPVLLIGGAAPLGLRGLGALQGPALRGGGQAAPPGPARAPHRGRRRLRPERHGGGDRRPLPAAHDRGGRQRRGLGTDPQPQLSFFGAERAVGTSLPFSRYDRMVEALGGRGVHVTDPDAIRPALARALGSGEVWCVNVELDPAAYRRTGQVSMAI